MQGTCRHRQTLTALAGCGGLVVLLPAQHLLLQITHRMNLEPFKTTKARFFSKSRDTNLVHRVSQGPLRLCQLECASDSERIAGTVTRRSS